MFHLHISKQFYLLSCSEKHVISGKGEPKFLKGQCHEIFCVRFFSWIIFPQICRHIRKSRCTACINDSGVKSVSTIQLANLPPVSTTPEANLPLLSTTPIFHRCHWCCCYWWQNATGGNNCHYCKQHQWQIIGTLSDCWHLKVNLKETLLPKGAQTN